jgi:hypothetical protein
MPLRLSQLPLELERAGFDCDHTSYRKLWQGAVERRFPARQVNGVWHFEPGDVPLIGAALRLSFKPPPRAQRQTTPRATA